MASSVERALALFVVDRGGDGDTRGVRDCDTEINGDSVADAPLNVTDRDARAPVALMVTDAVPDTSSVGEPARVALKNAVDVACSAEKEALDDARLVVLTSCVVDTVGDTVGAPGVGVPLGLPV